MPPPKSQFDAIHTGRADPSRYLIIGFDTEYQRYADEVTRTLNNEVLSYQYCCTVIERDGDDNSAPTWSGLLKPKGPDVSDRLALDEFLTSALEDGCARFPELKLPSTIYLVAHFTRADVPGFADFKDEATRSALQLDNIRNLFMNVANDIRLDLGPRLEHTTWTSWRPDRGTTPCKDGQPRAPWSCDEPQKLKVINMTYKPPSNLLKLISGKIPFNQLVTGSNPVGLTSFPFVFKDLCATRIGFGV